MIREKKMAKVDESVDIKLFLTICFETYINCRIFFFSFPIRAHIK